jgi:hypothetical protein
MHTAHQHAIADGQARYAGQRTIRRIGTMGFFDAAVEGVAAPGGSPSQRGFPTPGFVSTVGRHEVGRRRGRGLEDLPDSRLCPPEIRHDLRCGECPLRALTADRKRRAISVADRHPDRREPRYVNPGQDLGSRAQPYELGPKPQHCGKMKTVSISRARLRSRESVSQTMALCGLIQPGTRHQYRAMLIARSQHDPCAGNLKPSSEGE